VFADAGYWIALIDPRDQSHAMAVRVTLDLGNATLMTTDEVLTEVLNFFSGAGAPVRRQAAALVRRISQDDAVEIHEQTHASFLNGLELFEARLDKGYSLTDCISMAVIKEAGLREVLTPDNHFRQAGFVFLLR